MELVEFKAQILSLVSPPGLAVIINNVGYGLAEYEAAAGEFQLRYFRSRLNNKFENTRDGRSSGALRARRKSREVLVQYCCRSDPREIRPFLWENSKAKDAGGFSRGSLPEIEWNLK